jgi:release factor glutamine methyltransferase
MTSDALSRQAMKIEESRQRIEPFIKTFSGMDLIVLPKVFPGGTDTALLCDTIEVKPHESVLDIGTGTGAVAIKAALLGAAKVTGTDISPDAIKNALANKAKFGLTKINFVQTNVLPRSPESFDVITMNPPYTDNKAPDTAAGMFWDEGNAVLRTVFNRLGEYMSLDGRMYVSWPSFESLSLPASLARYYGYDIEIIGRRTGNSSGFEYYVYCITSNLERVPSRRPR